MTAVWTGSSEAAGNARRSEPGCTNRSHAALAEAPPQSLIDSCTGSSRSSVNAMACSQEGISLPLLSSEESKLELPEHSSSSDASTRVSLLFVQLNFRVKLLKICVWFVCCLCWQRFEILDVTQSTFSTEFGEIPRKFHQNPRKIRWKLWKIAKFWTKFWKLQKLSDENLLKSWIWSGAKEWYSCRSRKMLQNEYLVAKIGFDTAEI